VGADPAKGWGRPRSQNSPASNKAACDPTGVMTTACLSKKIAATRENPGGGRVPRSMPSDRTPARDRPGRLGSRRGP
jgi:hypothetical protein